MTSKRKHGYEQPEQTERRRQAMNDQGLPEDAEQRFYRWTIEIWVDPTWVADGFDLDNDRVHDMMARALPYAYGHELGGMVIAKPDPKVIRKEQGYAD